MGCDIHLAVERRVNGIWVYAPGPMRTCWSCKGAKVDAGQDPPTPCWLCGGAGEYQNEWYDNRNYDAFAILANVRNGSGFAGINTGDGFDPISKPRGWPDDLSLGAREGGDLSGSDHSYSWVLLSELLAVDWSKVTRKRGVVDAHQYIDWIEKRGRGQPASWCGNIMGPSTKVVGQPEMDALIRDGKVPPLPADADLGNWARKHPVATDGISYFAAIDWPATYAECADDLLAVARGELAALDPDPRNVRLVFGFDS